MSLGSTTGGDEDDDRGKAEEEEEEDIFEPISLTPPLRKGTPIHTRAMQEKGRDFYSGMSHASRQRRSRAYDPINTLQASPAPVDRTFDQRSSSLPIRLQTIENHKSMDMVALGRGPKARRIMDTTEAGKEEVTAFGEIPRKAPRKIDTPHEISDEDEDKGPEDYVELPLVELGVCTKRLRVGEEGVKSLSVLFAKSERSFRLDLGGGGDKLTVTATQVECCYKHNSPDGCFIDLDLNHLHFDLLEAVGVPLGHTRGPMRLTFDRETIEWKQVEACLEAFYPSTLQSAFHSEFGRTKRLPLRVPGRPPNTNASKNLFGEFIRRRSSRIFTAPSSKIDEDEVSMIDPPIDPNIRFLFNYPDDSAAESICLTSAETDRLRPGVFLNDTLIDFDILRTVLRLDEAARSRIHTFNCFFYKRLISKKGGAERFTRGVDVFAKDLLFVPINEAFHWYLGVIVNPGNSLNSKEVESGPEIFVSDGEDEEIRPKSFTHIVILDSLGQPRSGAIDQLKRFLIEEAERRHGVHLDKSLLKGRNLKVPRQPNMTDCGLFLLESVERALRDIDVTKTHFVDAESNLSDWFAPEAASRRRGLLLEEMQRLTAEFREKHPEEIEAHHQTASSDVELYYPLVEESPKQE